MSHALVGLSRRGLRPAGAFERLAGEVLDRAAPIAMRSDADLREAVRRLATTFRRRPEPSREALIEGLAVTLVMARRVLGFDAHPCQIMGALALHEGFLIEMATGEGKSLTAALVAPLAAWTGRPCHLVTVNDYLAGRDTEEMSAFYRACGVTVACVTDGMSFEDRRRAHAQDVTYTTGQQLLADFLRDRLAMGALQDPRRRLIRGMLEGRVPGEHGLVMRGLGLALVDEADSVLVDEAVTPLIISRTSENRPLIEATDHAVRISTGLCEGRDYVLDQRYREIRLTEDGRRRVESSSSDLGGLWGGSPRRVELVTQALVARELYQRDKHYVVQDGKVVIVDEFTGRLMPDRTWSHGLHQAVEAKEGLDVNSPTETMARLSFQRFYRLFPRLCGMSGTVREAAAELWNVYELPLVRVPTHRPCQRRELPDRVFPDHRAKLAAIVPEVVRLQAGGRPVLVGTRSVSGSEELAGLLRERGIPASVLNATRHREEAAIVARAGQRGQITIATNMAGRGTDIKLGEGVAALGGLHVIAVERHESGRIDRQLFGRCARQGDPGSSQAFLAPDDEIVRRFIPVAFRDGAARAIAAGFPGSRLFLKALLGRAQQKAQALARRQREHVFRTDEWIDQALSFADASNRVR